MENLGIVPSASRMQSERSTVWANPPVLEKLGKKKKLTISVSCTTLNTKPSINLTLIGFKEEQKKRRRIN